MDQTQRMTQLLGAMRRERNGAVADAMCVCGRNCGLNYGVSLPTVRQIARAVGQDDPFARYLWLQDVRELRLAALYIASPRALTLDALPAWEAGIINSELADEAASTLVSHSAQLGDIFACWIVHQNPFLQYTALRAATRRPRIEWLDAGMEALRRTAAAERTAAPDAQASYLIPRGVVTLLTALSMQDVRAVHAVVSTLGDTPAECYVREEMAWRLSEG